MLPFTVEQFFAIFASYGQAIWPLQIVAWLLGLVAVIAVARPGRRSDLVILGVLALMWAVTGLGYHLTFFTRINNAAYFFAALFVIQAGAFAAAMRCGLGFGWSGGVSGFLGLALIVYAAVVYPLIGLAMGHGYLAQPAFGVTPCPVTLFTFGVLLLTVAPVPRWLLVIPVMWSIVGGTAAFLLQVPQDWILLLSGATTALVLYFRDKSVDIAARIGPRV